MGQYTSYTASATTSIVVPFTCTYCAFASQMEVTEKASSTRKVGGWGHDTPEQQRNFEIARENAKENAAASAKHTAALVPCPRCARRNEREVRSHIITTIILSLIAFGLAGGAVYCAVDVATKLDSELMLGGLGLFLVVIAIFIPISARTTYVQAPSKARFVEGAPQQPAPQAFSPAPPQYAARQVYVRGPDGHEYVGRAVGTTAGHVNVAFPNGSATWIPEAQVRWG
jgi:uncharacterized membrane protein YidH (DUF202 family)